MNRLMTFLSGGLFSSFFFSVSIFPFCSDLAELLLTFSLDFYRSCWLFSSWSSVMRVSAFSASWYFIRFCYFYSFRLRANSLHFWW